MTDDVDIRGAKIEPGRHYCVGYCDTHEREFYPGERPHRFPRDCDLANYEALHGLRVVNPLDDDGHIRGFKLTLRPYQIVEVNKAMAADTRVILASKFQLGKTVTAEAIVQIYDRFPLLLVLPATLVPRWIDSEIPKAFEHISDKDVFFADRGNLTIPPGKKIVVVTYSIIQQGVVIGPNENGPGVRIKELGYTARHLRDYGFRSFIGDEGHRLKDRTTNAARVTRKLVKDANIDMILLLTATPISKGPKDAQSLIEILRRLPSFGGYDKFNRDYVAKDVSWSGRPQPWYANAFKQGTEVKLAAAMSSFMIQTTYEEAGIKKAQPFDVVEPCELTNVEEYLQAANDYRAWLDEKKTDEERDRALRAEGLTKLTTLRGLSAAGKVAFARELAVDLLTDNPDAKIVIVGHHVEPLRAIYELLTEEGEKAGQQGDIPEWKVSRLAAEDDPATRDIHIRNFNHKPDYRVVVASYRVGSEGIDLGAAEKILVLEYDWNPNVMAQMFGRVLSPESQKKPYVGIHYIMAADTLDERMKEVVQNKGLSIKLFGQGLLAHYLSGGLPAPAAMEEGE